MLKDQESNKILLGFLVFSSNTILWIGIKFPTEDTMNVWCFKAVLCKWRVKIFMQGFVLFAVIRHTPKDQLQEFHWALVLKIVDRYRNTSFGQFIREVVLELKASVAVTWLRYNVSGTRNEFLLIDSIAWVWSQFSVFSASRFLCCFFKPRKTQSLIIDTCNSSEGSLQQNSETDYHVSLSIKDFRWLGKHFIQISNRSDC
jgi:hypothetical protein